MTDEEKNVISLKEAYRLWNETKAGTVDHWLGLMTDDVHFRSLAEAKHQTLRDFLAVSKRTLVDLDDSGLNLDLDYPADYEAARALVAQTVARAPNPA